MTEWTQITAAIAVALNGEREEGRHQLLVCWQTTTDTDHAQRCVLAHYLADLEHVFSRIPADMFEVVLVDGNSVDGTIDVARRLRPDIKVVLQNRRGKGNALACGFAACTGDVIVMIDADGSTDPAEIPAFVAALTSGAD